MKVALVVILLAFSSPASAQTAQGLDGNAWREFDAMPAPRLVRMALVRGLLDGVTLGFVLMATEPSDTKETLAAAANYLMTTQSAISGVPVDQIVDGLNAFYGDYRNRRIRVTSATGVILREIGGMPKAQTEAWIEDLRRGAGLP